MPSLFEVQDKNLYPYSEADTVASHNATSAAAQGRWLKYALEGNEISTYNLQFDAKKELYSYTQDDLYWQEVTEDAGRRKAEQFDAYTASIGIEQAWDEARREQYARSVQAEMQVELRAYELAEQLSSQRA